MDADLAGGGLSGDDDDNDPRAAVDWWPVADADGLSVDDDDWEIETASEEKKVPQKTKKNRGWTSLEAANGAKLLDKTELSCALTAFLMPLRRLLLLDAADPLDPAMDLVYLLTSCMLNVRSLQRSALRGRGAWGDP